MEKTIAWVQSKSDELTPFKQSDSIFDKIEFRLNNLNDFSLETSFILEQLKDSKNISPEIKCVPNFLNIKENTGLNEEEIAISFILREQSLNLFEKIHSLERPYSGAPVKLDILNKLSGSGEFTIELIAHPTSSKERGFRVAQSHASIIAKKIIKVSSIKDNINFPIKDKDPADFEDVSLPEGTIFHINWLSEDISQKIDDMLEIWLNTKYEAKWKSLDGSNSKSTLGDLFVQDLHAKILFEMVYKVAGSKDLDGIPNENGSLFLGVKTYLESIGKDIQEIQSLLDRPDGMSRLRILTEEHTKQFNLFNKVDKW